MKKFFLIASAILSIASVKLFAAEGTWQVTSPESVYSVTQSTIAIGSSTVTTLLATNGYNKRTLYNVGVSTIYARFDSYYTTLNRVQAGFPIRPGEILNIENNNPVGLISEDKIGSTITLRVIQLQKY